MATIHLFSPMRHFGPWDWRNPDTPGIGGSETMHCEMAWRLAARGHRVISYAPLPPDRVEFLQADELNEIWCRQVQWRDISHADFDAPGLWILIRGMHWVGRFDKRPDQRLWCVFQDADMEPSWKQDGLDRVARFIGLCADHTAYLKKQHPDYASKIYQSRNGIRGDLVDQVLSEPLPVRNPHRLMFASSPDRGLMGLLDAFRLIRFLVPDAELHVSYGFDNIDQLPDKQSLSHHRAALDRLLQQPGVIRRGRLGQPELYREWLKAGLMVAPTNFLETGHISLMEAQALGAIPVVNPTWATGENLLAGFGLEGDAEHDRLQLRRFAMAAVALMQQPAWQDALRGPMMADARKRFDWEGVVDQYAQWIEEEGL